MIPAGVRGKFYSAGIPGDRPPRDNEGVAAQPAVVLA